MILRLRGAYQLFWTLNSADGKLAVDDELTKLGAETEAVRRHKSREELLHWKHETYEEKS